MIDIAYAMAPAAEGGSQQSPLGMFLPLAIIFAIFYFLMIRPQQKRQKQHKELLAGLKKGDTVITTGGLIGRVTGISNTVVTIEAAERIRLKVLRSQISSISSEPLMGEPPRKKSARKKSETEETEE